MSDAGTETRSVVVEREMAHPPEKVWRALTQPHLIEDWLKMKTDFKPEVGNVFTLKGDWGGVACEVLELEPHKRLAYRWDHPHAEPAYDLKSVVTFTLTPTATGTHLRMEQVGFRPEQKQAYGGARYGWAGHFDSLDTVLSTIE
jgi:uncharacterized protein YndB with AHSA1/START domain